VILRGFAAVQRGTMSFVHASFRRALPFVVVGFACGDSGSGGTGGSGASSSSAHGGSEAGGHTSAGGGGGGGGGGDGGGGGGEPCMIGDDCGPGRYCKAVKCGAGQCVAKPTGVPSNEERFVCGCDSVTYWNASLAAAAGVSVAAADRKCRDTV